MKMSSVLRFGIYELDSASRELRRRGVLLPLQELPFRLLLELVSRPGELVSREELRRVLWEEDVFVDFDAGLNTAVRRLREALGDSATNPRFIETVPRRGYRFLGAVIGSSREPAEAKRVVLWREPAVWVALAVAVAAGAGWWIGRSTRDVGTRRGAAETFPTEARVELLRARHFSERRSREGLEKAIVSYQSALASDPNLSEAYGGLAGSYLMLGVYDYWRPAEAFPPARRMAARALELDGGSAEGHMVSALLAAVADWAWDEAEAGIDRALALDPSLTEAHLWRGVLSMLFGRHDEGLDQTRRALELDPTSPVINTMLAWQHFYARRPADAIEQSRRTIELAPDYFDVWDNLKWMHIAWGNEAEAIEAWCRTEVIEHGRPTELCAALEEHGLEPVIREIVGRRLEKPNPPDAYRSPFDLVLELTAIGQVDLALDWLDKSFAERETDLVALAVDPRLDRLRGSPRFEAMVARIGVPGRE